jgi:hypothetical protein
MASIQRNSLAEYSHWQSSETKIIDGQPVRFCDVCVYEFFMSDVEDPEIYAAAPIWEWQQSPAGQWVTEHAVDRPYWIKQIDKATYGYQCRIMARLSEADQVFFKLKYVGTKN